MKNEEEFKTEDVSELSQNVSMDENVSDNVEGSEETQVVEIEQEPQFEVVTVDPEKVFCRKCKTELNGELYCPKCGKKVKSKSLKKKLSKKILIPIILVAVLAVGGIGFSVYKYVLVPYNQYTYAGKCVQEKKYDEAIKIYTDLKDYKDSEEKIVATYYEKGADFFEQGEYTSAIVAYEAAGGYKDSKECIQKSYYSQGNDLATVKKYSEAIEAYEKAGNYSDAAQKLAAVKEEKEFEELKDKLSRAYAKCESSDTTLSSDGLSITVDSKNEYDYSGLADIAVIMGHLELPNSLIDEMSNTNALMGRQTQEYDNIEVSWSYHPDNGLDVIFKIKK